MEVKIMRFSWLPPVIRTPLVKLKSQYGLYRRKKSLRQVADRTQRRIIIGAGGTNFTNWTPTERDVLDLLQEKNWSIYFPSDSLDAILAEHVWEHLTADDALIAAKNCFNFLKPGGYLRVAVPDGFHPDSSYIDAVKPGGTGPGSDDHKVLYNYQTFRKIFLAAGFDIHLYEYFDEGGVFVEKPWNPEDGMIQRSKKFDERNAAGTLVYTSIILDAKKLVKS
jgi:predicted SAM-dependent methyltransferase